MARPTKQGLDYFPFDINFFDDDKLVFVSKRFGLKGEIIAIRLLCRIYKNGYFTKWNDELAELFATRVGENITSALVNDVVNELVKRDFFNKDIFNRFEVLTSSGIQKRYLHACKQAKRNDSAIQQELTCSEFNQEETPKKPPIIPQKENESKGYNTEENRIEEEKIVNDKIFEILHSERWIQDTARIYKSETEIVRAYLIQFLDEQKVKNKIYGRSLNDIKEYFVNWVKRELEKSSAKKESYGKQPIIGTKAGQQHPLQSLNDLANAVLQSDTSSDS